MSRPLPVTLVAGFLGAGKTTLLNRLLAASSPLRVGVVQNERGLEVIDDAPVAARAKVEISEGCACCVRNPDLVAAVRDLSGRGDLDWLLFEASGLADPLPLAWTLGRPDLADRVRLDSVLIRGGRLPLQGRAGSGVGRAGARRRPSRQFLIWLRQPGDQYPCSGS